MMLITSTYCERRTVYDRVLQSSIVGGSRVDHIASVADVQGEMTGINLMSCFHDLCCG